MVMAHKHFRNPPFSLILLAKKLSGTFFALVLFFLLLVTNVAQMMSLVLLPFSKKFFRSVNRFCANAWWSACVITGKKLNGMKILTSGDPIPENENAILVVNHQQMADIYALMFFAKSKGRLGDLKWFVKDALKYVPGIGLGMLFLDCLFVKRNWEVDRDKIHSIFSKFRTDQIPVWLISFVEGTRIKPIKLKLSQEYAREKGLPVLEHVMLPRTKGFVASVEGLSGHIDAVYDVTIGYPDGLPSLWQIAQGTAKEIHLHVRRFSIDALPKDPALLNSWLVHRFVEKDHLLSSFYRNRSF
jgi:1-acyl-sn-glycerol-3-phosphate acyltransferase